MYLEHMHILIAMLDIFITAGHKMNMEIFSE